MLQRHQARHGRRAGAEPSALPTERASPFALQPESAAPSPRNGRRSVVPPPSQLAPPTYDAHYGLQPSSAMMRQRLSSQADALYRMAASGPRPPPQLPVAPPRRQGQQLLAVRQQLLAVRQQEPSEASESEVLRAHLEAGAMPAEDVLDDWIRRKHMRTGHQPRMPARDAPGSELRANLLSSKQNQWLVVDPTGNRKPGKTAYEQAFMKAVGGGAPGTKPAAAAPSSGIAHQWTFGALGDR